LLFARQCGTPPPISRFPFAAELSVTSDPTASLLSLRRETSGHAAADGRFAWAQAAWQDGNTSAAAELCEQALLSAPAWAPAWFTLGEAHERLGDRTAAAVAFEKARTFDPSGRLGADLRLAALGAGAAPPHPSEAYVSQLFDQYASRFEEHLVGTLAYRGPALLLAAFEALGPRRFGHGLDVGCGTGLAARLFAPHVARFTGVDLSPAMAAAARRTGLYERVAVAEAAAFLTAEPAGSADLVLAADVLVYIGDLAPLMAGVMRILCPGGLFLATAQTGPEGGWSLGQDLRYAQSPAYLEAAADASGLRLVHLAHAWARREHGEGVPGLVLGLAKA
jgi:predicted TPR repeat methyltransferase